MYDAYIPLSTGTGDYNYGAAGIVIGRNSTGNGLYRTCIKGDLSSIPAGSTVTAAVLSLYCNADRSTNATTYRLFRIRRDWIEGTKTGAAADTGEVTWNSAKHAVDAWGTAGCSNTTSDREDTDVGSRDFTDTEKVNEYKDFPLTASSVTAMITGGTWTNYGWLAKADLEDSGSYSAYGFNSSENGAANTRPTLTVTYTEASTTCPVWLLRHRSNLDLGGFNG